MSMRVSGGPTGYVGVMVAVTLAASALAACDQPESTRPVAAKSGAARHLGRGVQVWANGTRYSYVLRMKSSLAVVGSKAVAFELASELVVDARKLEGETFQLAATLPTAKFSAVDPAARGQFDALAAELSAPCVFKLERGRLGEVRLRAGASSFASSISRTVAAALQVADRPATDQSAWLAKETDGTGSYEAEYRWLAEPGRLSKRKVRYEPLSLGKPVVGNFRASVQPEITSSTGTIALRNRPGAGASIEHVKLEDHLLTRLGDTSTVVSETALELSLTQQSTPTTRVDWAALVGATRPFDPNAAEKAPDANYDAIRIGKYTFETALAELEQQARDPKRHEIVGSALGVTGTPDLVAEREARLGEQSRVFTAMAALLRSQDRNVPLAAARIRASSDAARVLLDALSSAGTPDAQVALIGVMEDAKLSLELRRRAAFALSRTTSASSEAVSALARLQDDPAFRLHALYGLGTIGRRLREAGAVERAEQIVGILVEALGKAASTAAKVQVLRGIANSGHAKAFDAVRPFFSAPEGKVRVAAVDAIRLMNHQEVDPILVASLTDSLPDVQMAAVEAISVREPTDTLVRALGPAADKIEKVATRVKLVKVMGHYLKQRPELRAVLEKLATSDPSRDVQQAARAAVGA